MLYEYGKDVLRVWTKTYIKHAISYYYGPPTDKALFTRPAWHLL